MIPLQLRNSIILVILSFIIGFGTSFVFDGCNHNPSASSTTIVSPKDLKKAVEVKDKQYQASISKLENENSRLTQNLKEYAFLLDKVKQSTKQKETKIKKSIDKGFAARALLQIVNGGASDSITGLAPCNSLVQEVTGYMEDNRVKDSLYEAHIATQDSIIILKDSVIELRTKQSDELKVAYHQSLDNQQTLSNENNLLKKRSKRQKLKQKIISVGLMIISGVGANYLLNR